MMLYSVTYLDEATNAPTATAMSPTARTLKQLREDGWVADVVERWIPGANVRRDFLGGIDVIAAHDIHGIVGIQVTTASNASSRVKKLLAEPRMKTWLAAFGKLQVWGAKVVPGRQGRRKWLFAIWHIRLVDGELVADKPPRKKCERKLFR